LKTYGDIDSKFRFVILAAKRAKQLIRGAKPFIKSKSKNPIRIAQNEVTEGLVDYEIIQSTKEEIVDHEAEAFIGEEVGEEAEEIEEKKVTKKKPKGKKKAKDEDEKEAEDEKEGEDEAEEAEDVEAEKEE